MRLPFVVSGRSGLGAGAALAAVAALLPSCARPSGVEPADGGVHDATRAEAGLQDGSAWVDDGGLATDHVAPSDSARPDLFAPVDAEARDAASAERPSPDHFGADRGEADASVSVQADLFVAPDGQGSTCSATDPCDLSAAAIQARALAPSLDRDLRVVLRGGRYALSATWVLGAQDSGQGGHFIVYEAYPGERPVLSGGVHLGAWTVHDAELGIFVADAPAGLRTRQLFVDGRRARRARSDLDPPGFSVVTDGYQGPASLDGWGNITEVELVDQMQWKLFRCTIASVSAGHVVMKQPCWSLAQWHTNLGMEAPSWIENAYELLDRPGEWYHDRGAKRIYYIPLLGQDLSRAEVVASSLQTLLRVEGAHHLVFRGLSFAHSTWLRPGEGAGYPVLQAGQLLSGELAGQPRLESTPAAVVVRHSSDLIFERNRFEHLGAVGLELGAGSRRCQVGGNRFVDLSAGAVHIGDVNGASASESDLSAEHNVANNIIADVGVEYLDSPGILLTYARACRIDHNELHGLPYTGVSLGWGWGMQASVLADNQVSGNRIGHVMLRLNDGGLIYTLNTQPGARITGNLLYAQVHDYGGIYLDQGSQHLSIGGNVVASTPRWYFLQSGSPPRAQSNVLHDNFSDSAEVGCCGSLGCCDEVNSLANNSVFSPSAWPEAARQIALSAGIDPAYADLRPRRKRVEAEAYLHGGEGVGFHEIPSWWGDDNDYRHDRVDVQPCEVCSNDHRLSGVVDGEWLAYDVFVDEDDVYELAFFGVGGSGGELSLRVDGVDLAPSLALAASPSTQPVEIGTRGELRLEAGMHVIRLELQGDPGLDFFELRR